jgi:molybdate transport system regulatory protein
MGDRTRPVVRLHLWLETGEGVLFGSGRAQLLERIVSCGSLKSAADSLGMSYRAAWGKIKKTEEILGFRLIEKSHGNRAGYQLTEFGRLLMASFRQWFDDVERMALARARELFPYDAQGYEESIAPRDPEGAELPAAAGAGSRVRAVCFK